MHAAARCTVQSAFARFPFSSNCLRFSPYPRARQQRPSFNRWCGTIYQMEEAVMAKGCLWWKPQQHMDPSLFSILSSMYINDIHICIYTYIVIHTHILFLYVECWPVCWAVVAIVMPQTGKKTLVAAEATEATATLALIYSKQSTVVVRSDTVRARIASKAAAAACAQSTGYHEKKTPILSGHRLWHT